MIEATDRSGKENGIVLLLISVLVFAFAAFLALVIDHSQVASSHHKQHKTAELAALAALTGYQAAPITSLDPVEQYKSRLIAAVDRAEEVIGMEENNLRLGASGRQLDPALHELKETSGVAQRMSGAAGSITPGVWYFDEPSETCGKFKDQVAACPCPGGFWKKPCFQANGAGAVALTAFEVNLNTKAESPIRYVFGRLVGAEGVGIRSRGRASVKPRMSITGIDLSLSITGDDNIDWDDLPSSDPKTNFAKSSAYVFPLDDSDPNSRCRSETDYYNPCLKDPGAGVSACKFKVDSHFGPMWYNLEPDRYAKGSSFYYPRIKHFRNDYSCWIVNNKHYLIDTSRHGYDSDGNSGTSEGTYYGPEPFVSILSSFSQALSEVENRTVPGDQIALFGFDQDADLFGPRYIGPANPGDSKLWTELKDLTNISGADDFRGDVEGAKPHPLLKKRIAEHHFFPRPPDSYTDIAGALLTATRTVDNTALGGDGSIDVTLLTDGLANVPHWAIAYKDKSTGLWDMTPDVLTGCTSMDRYLTYSDSCWFKHNEAIYDAVGLITWDPRFWMSNSYGWFNFKLANMKKDNWIPLSKRGFRLNVALFSKDVQPHTVLKRGSDGKSCLDDEDARKSWRKFFVSYDDDTNGYQTGSCYNILGAPDACPYLNIADVLYTGFALPTGGLFVPIRKPCNTDAINENLSWGLSDVSCAGGALEEKLDSQLCAPFTEKFEQYGHTYDYSVAFQESLKPKVNALIAAGAAAEEILGIAEDGKGEVTKRSDVGMARMICDTKCRTPEQQLREMYKTIFESNPYVLVRDDE